MMRGTSLDALRRGYGGAVRGRLERADDSKLLQVVDLRHVQGEENPTVERFQHYSHTSVPLPPDGPKGAEVVTVFINGNRAHPIAVAIDDRRHRPKNLKPGESSGYDDQGQYSKIARDGHHRVALKHTFTAAGDQVRRGGATPPDTTFELNEQLKGLSARMAQAEHNLHGLFDVTSRFRQIVQTHIPEVSEVAPILNQDPSGLPVMADAISGKEMAYLQQQVTQALQKFLSPNLAGLSSLLSGGLEASIGGLKSQIEGLAVANPVVGQVDDLQAEMTALGSSGNTPSIIAAGTTALQQQITALTASNPIVGQVTGLRSALNDLVGQAGPALNFLEPQKRLVQGISRSLRLQKP